MTANFIDYAAVRDALADLLRSSLAKGIDVLPRWSGVSIPSLIPCVVIQPAPEPVTYHEAFADGLATMRFKLTAYVPFTEDGALLLDQMMSSGTGADGNSINDAIEADRAGNGGTSLGGLVKEFAVLDPVRWVGSVVFDTDGARAWAAEWTVSAYQPHRSDA